jgi:hypothetical protein
MPLQQSARDPSLRSRLQLRLVPRKSLSRTRRFARMISRRPLKPRRGASRARESLRPAQYTSDLCKVVRLAGAPLKLVRSAWHPSLQLHFQQRQQHALNEPRADRQPKAPPHQGSPVRLPVPLQTPAHPQQSAPPHQENPVSSVPVPVPKPKPPPPNKTTAAKSSRPPTP